LTHYNLAIYIAKWFQNWFMTFRTWINLQHLGPLHTMVKGWEFVGLHWLDFKNPKIQFFDLFHSKAQSKGRRPSNYLHSRKLPIWWLTLYHSLGQPKMDTQSMIKSPSNSFSKKNKKNSSFKSFLLFAFCFLLLLFALSFVLFYFIYILYSPSLMMRACAWLFFQGCFWLFSHFNLNFCL